MLALFYKLQVVALRQEDRFEGQIRTIKNLDQASAKIKFPFRRVCEYVWFWTGV